jgi:urea transport system substrate-binding protein
MGQRQVTGLTRRISRRNFGRHAGAASTLAAARGLAPFVFVGCMPTGVPAGRKPIRVGLLHSQTGTMAISETSLRDVELFAFEQINATGGLLGRQIEVWGPDPKSRTDLYPKRAGELLDWGAAAVFGCWTSSSRKAVVPLFEERDRLLFYPVQYEGNESSSHVVYGGMVPNQQVLPVIDWLASPAGGGKKKIFLLGSDYVFPRTANFVAKKYLTTKGMRPAGEMYLPLGHKDFEPVVNLIRASGAECVLSTINGDSNIGWFNALAAARVDPEKLPVVSTSIAEDELRNLLPENVAGHLAASCYFQSLPTETNRRWVADFRREFGHDRVTGDPLEPQWGLVHLWREAVERAGSLDTQAVRAAMREGLEFEGPGGTVRLDPKTQHCTRFFRLGRIRTDRQFDIVHQSDAPIEPDPYPQIAFPGWSCDWTKGGITRGPEVSIDGDI